jgi:hypothetical protein
MNSTKEYVPFGSNKVIPMNKREAVLWNYFNSGQHFYPIYYWPKCRAQDMLTKHKNNLQRLNLMLFLIGNGVDPTLTMAYIMLNGERTIDGLMHGSICVPFRGHIRSMQTDYYDSSATQQMHYIANNYSKMNYNYYDMLNKKYEKIGIRMNCHTTPNHE